MLSFKQISIGLLAILVSLLLFAAASFGDGSEFETTPDPLETDVSVNTNATVQSRVGGDRVASLFANVTARRGAIDGPEDEDDDDVNDEWLEDIDLENANFTSGPPDASYSDTNNDGLPDTARINIEALGSQLQGLFTEQNAMTARAIDADKPIRVTNEIVASAIADPDSTPGNGVEGEDDQATTTLHVSDPNVADLEVTATPCVSQPLPLEIPDILPPPPGESPPPPPPPPPPVDGIPVPAPVPPGTPLPPPPPPPVFEPVPSLPLPLVEAELPPLNISSDRDTPNPCIEVHNNGPAVATDVEVDTTKLVDKAGKLVARDITGDTSPDTGSYDQASDSWSVGNLEPGQTATMEVDPNPGAQNNVTIVAEVAGSGTPDPDSSPDDSSPSEDDRASSKAIVPAINATPPKAIKKDKLRTGFKTKIRTSDQTAISIRLVGRNENNNRITLGTKKLPGYDDKGNFTIKIASNRLDQLAESANRVKMAITAVTKDGAARTISKFLRLR